MNPANRTSGNLLAAAAMAAWTSFLSLQVAAQELPMRDPAADVIDFSPKPFHENKTQLPPAPKTENLIRFDTGPTRPGFENFVDGANLSLGADGVIRYTLVVKSDMGALNVSYEGIRCVTREHKVYAYGRRDGTWIEARDSEWKTIGQPSVEGPIYVLYNDFFCPGRQGVRSSAEAIAALKAGGHPRASDESAFRLIPLDR